VPPSTYIYSSQILCPVHIEARFAFYFPTLYPITLLPEEENILSGGYVLLYDHLQVEIYTLAFIKIKIKIISISPDWVWSVVLVGNVCACVEGNKHTGCARKLCNTNKQLLLTSKSLSLLQVLTSVRGCSLFSSFLVSVIEKLLGRNIRSSVLGSAALITRHPLRPRTLVSSFSLKTERHVGFAPTKIRNVTLRVMALEYGN
jgi:hypothetical protein